MKLLYVVDGRSPTALNWISYFIRSGHEVHMASTYACLPIAGLASMMVIPVAMSGYYSHLDNGFGGRGRLLRQIVPVKLRTRMRQLVAPFSFPRAVNSLVNMIESIQPDLIHAMRIPYEGMIATAAMRRMADTKTKLRKPPLLTSVWGNDFTLHAKSTPILSAYTRQALQSVDGLHTDCQRDQRLALEFGFEATKPRIVLPGGGGVQKDIFYPVENGHDADVIQPKMGKRSIIILNPRGFRAYVRNDTFFRTIPMVVDRYPEVHFVCTGMSGEEQAQRWISELGIGDRVELLPPQSHPQMAELFRQAQISLSITTHDGTPNTLLEAMACGCFPIAGDIESLREWITPGVNGLLVDPGNPEALADAIFIAISNPELRRQARERNLLLVRERAEYEKCMHAAEEFYQQLITE